nr:hypothetical protein [uncultured Campylobacter sp.]
MAENSANEAATTAEQIISTNIAKINDSAIEFYANNINILNEVAKKYPMLNRPEKIELANKQILANASPELLEYSKFLNGGSLPNDARLLGKNAGRMILKSLDAGASSAEVINMLLKAGISGRNSTAAKALLQTGDINAYNAVMRQGESELIAELSNNVRNQAKNESIAQILNSAKEQAIKNDEMLKKGIGNQDLDDVTAKFISEKSGKEFEVAENGFGRELMKYEGKEASDDMKRSFSAWEAQGQKADITLNDGRKVVYLSPDEAVELSYGNAYLYGHKSYEELMATKMAESLEQKFNRLKTHPAYENLLKMRENTLARELKGEKVGGSKPTVFYEPQSQRYLRTGGGGGIDNPEREIRISKSDVAKLRSGKADVALAIKLENSLEALTGDPAASGVLDHLLTRDFHLGTAEYKKGLVAPKTAENSRISSDEVAKNTENSRIQDDIDAALWKGVEETQNFIIKARRNFEIKHNITPIKEFGTNYAEFYHGGANAIRKLFAERQGQVAGAFERKELEKLSGNGDIDLVWGEAKTANGDIKGYGLSKIEAKHLNDFASFNGDTPHDKLINGLNEIIEKGEIESKNGVDTIIYKKGNSEFKVGLSKGWDNQGKNNWIITAYNNKKVLGSSETSYHDTFTAKEPLANQRANSTTSSVKSQAENQANLAQFTAEFSKAYNAIKNIGKYTGLFENDYKQIASLSLKDFTQRLKNDIQAYEELAELQEIAYKATNGLLDNDEYMRYFNVTQGQKGYLTKAQSIQNNAFEILDQAPNYISGLYNEISRLKALKTLNNEQDETLNKALKQVNTNAILDLAGGTNYKLMATKIKTALNALMRAKKILDEAPKPKATTTANKSGQNIKSTGKMPEISAGSKIKNEIFKNFMADEGVVQAAIVNDFANFKLFAKNKLDDLLVDAYQKSPDETRKLFDNVIGEFEPALKDPKQRAR